LNRDQPKRGDIEGEIVSHIRTTTLQGRRQHSPTLDKKGGVGGGAGGEIESKTTIEVKSLAKKF